MRKRAPKPRAARAPTIRSLENSLKRLEGQQKGIESARILAKKEEEERALRASVAANPSWQKAYGDAWTRIDAAYAELPRDGAPDRLFDAEPVDRGHPCAVAGPLLPAEPEGNAARTALLSDAPLYPELEEAVLGGWLETARRTLGDDDPFVKAALQGRPARDVAHEAIAGTRLLDLAARKALVDGGTAAIRASTDPLIALARRVDPIVRDVLDWRDNRIRSVEAAAGQQIASARFEVYGRSVYPDANFTLRLGYGRTLGYEEDSTLVPWKTTFFGLFDRAEGFGDKTPYDLTERWRNGRTALNLSTPLNFVYTGDTVGGNSGSPVVNRRGEIVGINFDSNQQKLANRYAYIDEADGGRAIAVHSAAIIESLTKLYGAHNLVAELQAVQPAAAAAAHVVAGVGRAEPQLHDQQRPAARGLVARGRTAGRVEPAARERPLEHPRRRGPPLHDVPGRRAAPRTVERGRNRRLDGRGHRQDAVGVQVPVANRRLQPRRRPARDAAHRRRPAVHRRHQPSIPRIRQAHRQSVVVARSRRRVRRPAAAHQAGREVGPCQQPDRLQGHGDHDGRRSGAVADGVPPKRRRASPGRTAIT